MRRSDRMLPVERTRELLERETMGILSLITPEGEPYGVPLNYYYDPAENAIFFHCAREGKKLRCIARCPRVAFTVAVQKRIDPLRFTTYYESVMAFGTATILTDDEERYRRLLALCRHLGQEGDLSFPQKTAQCLPPTCVVRVDIAHLTGKCNPLPVQKALG